DLVYGGVGDRHPADIVGWHRRVAVRAVRHEWRTQAASVQGALHGTVGGVVAPVEADLHQVTTTGHVRVKDAQAGVDLRRERLLAEDRFARLDRGKDVLFVGRAPGRDDHSVHVIGANERLAGWQSSRSRHTFGHAPRTVQVDVGHRDHLRTSHRARQPADVLLADVSNSDHANSHAHRPTSRVTGAAWLVPAPRPKPRRYSRVRTAIGSGTSNAHGYRSCSTTTNSSRSSALSASTTDPTAGAPFGGSTHTPRLTAWPNGMPSSPATREISGSTCLM